MLFGLRLRDGSRVAFKALRDRPGLAASREVQTALHAAGFPCPKPLAGPLPFGSGVAFVDDWVEAPQRNVHEPARRAAAARTLARLIATAPRVGGLPRALEPVGLFPRPHHPRFDFARADGRWIDEIAAGALGARKRDGTVVVGHGDWSAKHLGWDGDRVAVVYDWPDSLVADAEETIVGQASAVFPATWDLPVTYVASPGESEAFVAEYEEAAGRRLDPASVAAARTYLLAYCARCELSDLDGAEGDFQQALRQPL
jgi:Phosphotransferase enzyme family